MSTVVRHSYRVRRLRVVVFVIQVSFDSSNCSKCLSRTDETIERLSGLRGSRVRAIETSGSVANDWHYRYSSERLASERDAVPKTHSGSD